MEKCRCFLEITPDELQTIEARYPVGTHLWRALMYHFTPYDCNFPYGPPPCSAGPGDSDPLPGNDSHSVNSECI